MNPAAHRTAMRDRYRRRHWPMMQEHRCAICGDAGHNRRTCARGPVLTAEPVRVPIGDECRPDRPAHYE